MSLSISLDSKRNLLLETPGHLLIKGGPGSGKTTIALLKAAHIIEANDIARDQYVLFLSFARATIARVMAQLSTSVSETNQLQIESSTYHGFSWNFIQTHGYLITGQRKIHILTPPIGAARMAGVPKHEYLGEYKNLLKNEGLLAFDLFAPLAADLVEGSDRLIRLIANKYPVIILDEFQDTNLDEWRLIKALGKHCRLIALADPEQRIYDFRGADPARVNTFKDFFSPIVFDFESENNRSNGTDIAKYGNDLIAGTNRSNVYKNVDIIHYPYNRKEPLSCLKYTLLNSMRRLNSLNKKEWSIAILVRSKKFMLGVSSYLSSESEHLKSIKHNVSIDPEGPALSALLIGTLLEGNVDSEKLSNAFLADLISHIRGRAGKPNQKDFNLTTALEGYLQTNSLRGTVRNALLNEIRNLSARRQILSFVGNPEKDWMAVRELLASANHEKIKSVAEDAKYIRLLNRGTQLRTAMSEQWRIDGSYKGVRAAIEDSLTQEYFSASARILLGINLMTIHKAKGKEFDEVIIIEGFQHGRLLHNESTIEDIEDAKLLLRVAITRAKMKTTILTPQGNSCLLI
jgi:DNA helicase-2/ATP-dependent DNA helicase PcrA